MSNIPDFAKALGALPKRAKRNGLQQKFGRVQEARAGTLLVQAELDPTKFVGRIIKLGNGRYEWMAFPGLHTEAGANDLITKGFDGRKGRAKSVLSAITQCRVAYAHGHAEADASTKRAVTKQLKALEKL